MARVTQFDIFADDLARAGKFYTEVFGWSVNRWEGPMEYYLVTTGPDNEPGINGAITARQTPVTGAGVTAFVCTVDVASVDDIAAKVATAGGQVAGPKFPIPGVGFVAYFLDTEGNLFSVREYAAN